MPTIAIIDYGAGNLRSIHKALQWVAERPPLPPHPPTPSPERRGGADEAARHPHPPTPSPEGRGGAETSDLPSPFRGGLGGGVGVPTTICVTADPAVVAAADAVVLPGVGAAGATMRRLAECNLIAPLQRAATDGRPFLGVCLGLQLLFTDLEEDGVAGLGVLPGRARRLPGGVKVPHMGWNTVEMRNAECGMRNWSTGIFAGVASDTETSATNTEAQPSVSIPHSAFRIPHSDVPQSAFRNPQSEVPHFYFVHSYYVEPAAEAAGAVVGVTTYGLEFCSVLVQGPLWATQFHPEKSGAAGLRLLANFVAQVKDRG